jgi:uncharacterized protein (UPF0332 family)
MAKECCGLWRKGVLMTRQKIVSREKYEVYEYRANEYYDMMYDAFEKEKYEVCAGNAIHCAINSVDALLVLALGRKSAGQNHNEVILLLKDVRASDDEERRRVCDYLYKLLELKTPVEYGDKKTSKKTAEKAMGLCKKIHLFTMGEIERLRT